MIAILGDTLDAFPPGDPNSNIPSVRWVAISNGSFNVFLHQTFSQDWYCEEGAAPRQDFRRRRVEELLQSRRHVATILLAYVPTPYLFRELPRSIPPPLPPTVR